MISKMKALGRALTIQSSHRWWISVPFVFALVSLVYLLWATWLVVIQPFDGILSFHPTGLVSEIDLNSPTAAVIQSGDKIVSVDGIPFSEASPLYAGKKSGDTVVFLINRSDQLLTDKIVLMDPPLEEILVRLAPLLVALIFWSIGVGVQAFKPAYEATNPFFLFFLASVILITTGSISSVGPFWTPGIFYSFLWLIGPLAVHFHIYFPQKTSFRGNRILLTTFYLIAVLGGISYWLPGSPFYRTSPWFAQIFTLVLLFLAFNLLIVVGLLIYSYRHAVSPGVRSQIRIVVLGEVLSLLALVQLTILPDALFKQPIIPYAYGFLLLGIIPLTYGYAIFRHRLIEIERHINRGATFIIVYSMLGGVYLILYAFLHRWLPVALAADPLINTVLVLVLASIYVPFNRQVQRVVDTVFYGGWYDYLSAVSFLTQNLEQITDLRQLAQTLADRLSATLRLEDACVFLRDLEGNLTVIEVAPREKLSQKAPLSNITLPRSSLAFLLHLGDEVGRSSLRQALSEAAFTPEEHQLLHTEQDHLWVPIIGHSQVQGMLALGPKYGGDLFSGEDIDILRIVARQIGPIIENIHLLTQLRQYANVLEQRVRERTAELHDAKERVEAILASVGDGVIVTDTDGTIRTVNSAYEEQSGYAASNVYGKKLYTLLEEQNPAKQLESMRQTLTLGKVWSGELVGRHKDGSNYDIQLTMAPIRNQSGQMVGYVGSQRDITRQKELDRLKDIFVSDVSHELRTPTSNISLYLELLEDAPPERNSQYLNVLKEQSQLLRKLVEDILDLSRLTMGKSKRPEFLPVDLNALTEQVLKAHQPLADISNLSLVFEKGAGLTYVNGEPNQLARVVTNLVSNALRYTFQGGICVRTYMSGTSICLEVEDTGMGIEAEDIPHLFERFYRGKKVRQTNIHGTGLGLAIVKEIVDLHEGKIEVESEFGKGARITVRLPGRI
jgi:PAS domain S-box-containing protein